MVSKDCYWYFRTTVLPQKCASCLYGKKYINPNKGSTICKYDNREGGITAQKIQPSDLIFTDQYHKSDEGSVFIKRGHYLHKFKCLGGTFLFYFIFYKIVYLVYRGLLVSFDQGGTCVPCTSFSVFSATLLSCLTALHAVVGGGGRVYAWDWGFGRGRLYDSASNKIFNYTQV